MPETCGFSNCSYSYTGIYTKDNMTKKAWSNWKNVGNKFETFWLPKK